MAVQRDDERKAAPRRSDPLLAQVGGRLRASRRELGLTLADMAARTGLTKDFISRTELGKQAITVRTLSRLVTGLNTTMAIILEGIAEDAAESPQ